MSQRFLGTVKYPAPSSARDPYWYMLRANPDVAFVMVDLALDNTRHAIKTMTLEQAILLSDLLDDAIIKMRRWREENPIPKPGHIIPIDKDK